MSDYKEKPRLEYERAKSYAEAYDKLYDEAYAKAYPKALAKGYTGAYADAYASGYASGYAEGREESFRMMLSFDIPAETIAANYGMSVEDVMSLSAQ